MFARPSWAGASAPTCVFFLLTAAVLLGGCDASPIVLEDAGPRPDGSIVTTDAGPISDAPRMRRDAATECSTDGDCDDGDESTHEYCQPFFGMCVETECTLDEHCDDGDPCTTDYCLSMANCGHGSDGRCCETEAECFDGNDCTSDFCGDDQLCDWAPVPGPGCGTCQDFDMDGAGASWCGGGDCDDFDATRSPTLAENCTNGRDDDCDGATDVVDTTCRPTNLMCPGTAVALETATHGTVITPGSGTPTMGCGASAFYTLTLSETSDVEVTLMLDMPSTEPPCPGCPPPSGPMQINYRAYLETSCGDRTTDVLGGGSCNYWDPSGGFFGGAQSSTYSHRRVPAGTYTLEVQAGPMFAWMSGSTGFTVTARATPSADATCDGTMLAAGTSVRGDTTGGLDAFGTGCDGVVRAAPERIHPFTVSTRSRVRLEVSPDESSAGSWPGARLAILSSCDAASATRVACLESSGYTCQATATIERVMEPGSYEALVEGTSGLALAYGLRLDVEPLGAACTGAPVISASGMTNGTTVGHTDEFRDDRACGSGRGPDAVYRLELAARSRVVLDAIASYSRPLVRIYTGCGEARIAASGSTPRIDTMLEAGSYDVVVGGERAEDQGTFVLSTTILPL